ncbi:MAG: hypothetical protein FWG65_11795 [Turicibacter sp.]|nr:hypothetical protein [Turicibacter sp.]
MGKASSGSLKGRNGAGGGGVVRPQTIYDRLESATTRDGARAMLDGLSGREIQEIARHYSIGGLINTRARRVDAIVSMVVGVRSNRAAVAREIARAQRAETARLRTGPIRE